MINAVSQKPGLRTTDGGRKTESRAMTVALLTQSCKAKSALPGIQNKMHVAFSEIIPDGISFISETITTPEAWSFEVKLLS